MRDWTEADRLRHKLLLEQCRDERTRTRQLVQLSQKLTAGWQSADLMKDPAEKRIQRRISGTEEPV